MTPHDTDVVSSLRLEIARQMTQDRFDLWFSDAELEIDEPNRIAKVIVAHGLALDWIRMNVRNEVQRACELVLGSDCAVHYGLRAQARKKRPVAVVAERVESGGNAAGARAILEAENGATGRSKNAASQSISRRRYSRFDDFVVGACNKVAFSAARIVPKRLGETSPLFLYGPTGVGKSHLLESILAEARQTGLPRPVSHRGGHRRCVHLSSEQFTFGFVQSLRGQGLPTFRRRHREVDLLVIEDVHFLEGKRATISELVHTIDAVTNDGGQLAFSSQLPPSELGALGEELVNRFCSGLVIQLRAADRPSREAILRNLANKRGLPLNDGVVRLIADRVVGDVRKLHGTVNQLSALRAALGREIDVELAEDSLKPYFANAPHDLSLRDIEKAVCAEFHVDPQKLKSDTRTQRISAPRMLAMFLARKYTRAALSEIGEHFGRRSHSSVVAADKKMKRLLNDGVSVGMADTQCTIDEAVKRVEQRLRAS